MKNRKDTKLILVHCSATRPKQDVGALTINKWHLNRGIYSERGLTGYHFINRRSGSVELGRDLPSIGAHALGFNDISVGICMVGGARKAVKGETPDWEDMVAEDNFTERQFEALKRQVQLLMMIYPEAAVIPHNAVSSKACPSFDVWKWQHETFKYDDSLRGMKIVEEILGEGET